MNQTTKSYNKIAKQFHSDRAHIEAADSVKAFAEKLPNEAKILDIGCGSGVPNAKYLLSAGFKVTGIEPSTELFEIAKENIPDAELINIDLFAFEQSKEFDGIIAWDSLFHLRPDEHIPAFEKISKMLKSGGYFLFTHGGSEGEITGEMHGSEFYYSSPGPEKIKKILKSLNFELEEWDLDKAGNGYLIALAKKI